MTVWPTAGVGPTRGSASRGGRSKVGPGVQQLPPRTQPFQTEQEGWVGGPQSRGPWEVAPTPVTRDGLSQALIVCTQLLRPVALAGQ